jgi:hypothetical protein
VAEQKWEQAVSLQYRERQEGWRATGIEGEAGSTDPCKPNKSNKLSWQWHVLALVLLAPDLNVHLLNKDLRTILVITSVFAND